MSHQVLIQNYLAGIDQLRDALRGLSPEQLKATPVPGKWSTLQVVCHLADFEPIYADRIKRVISEDQPLILSGDPDLFAAHLAYLDRDVEEELAVIASIRTQLARILSTLPEAAFQRTGTHSTDGPISLETLLIRITNHLPHHIKFILEKRAALHSAPNG